MRKSLELKDCSVFARISLCTLDSPITSNPKNTDTFPKNID